ncbi:Tubulin epsilon chain [Entophlyctis luteolus]|nr:Tubulin epsilon chain [Entophlyctis luteolus]
MPQCIVVPVGQCGNQIAARFWDRALQEQEDHCRPSASAAPSLALDAFFALSTSGKARHRSPRLNARAVLVDMEEGVINQVLASPLRTLFSDDQIVSSNSGSGNNWAVGYATYGASHGQAIEEALRMQAEQCDSLQAFFLLSSLGGGTGSGLGSFVIELLADCYPDVYRFSVPVCPSEDDDVVTSPYNTMLSLAKLIESADCVLPVENQALIDICNKISPAKSRDPNAQKANSSVTIIDSGTKPYGGLCAGTRKKLPFDEMNNIVANLILNVTASMRFEGSMNVDINDIVTNLVPFPQQKFLFSSMTPLTVSADVHIPSRRLDQMFSEAFSKDCQLLKADPKSATYLACALMGKVMASVFTLESRWMEDGSLRRSTIRPFTESANFGK